MTYKANLEEDVARLKEWYSKQHHLPQNIDDHHFYNFVCGTNSMEKAKRKIDAYFSLRSKCLELLSGFYPNTEAYRSFTQAFYSCILPDKTPDGCRVMFCAYNKKSTLPFHTDAFYLRLLYMMELALEMWPTDVQYLVFNVYDGVPVSVWKSIDIRHTAALAKLWVEGIPMKMKADHIMKAHSVFYKLEPLLRTFVSKKLNERIYLHRDDSKIKEVLPVSMIPAEYGGEGKTLKELSDHWTDLIDKKASWFEDKLKLRSDESKRSKDSAWKGDLDFGIDGSFKSLNID